MNKASRAELRTKLPGYLSHNALHCKYNHYFHTNNNMDDIFSYFIKKKPAGMETGRLFLE